MDSMEMVDQQESSQNQEVDTSSRPPLRASFSRQITGLLARSRQRTSREDNTPNLETLEKWTMAVLHEGESIPSHTGIIADFVLVHGLTGDYINTWTANPNRTSWCCWPGRDQDDVYCWPRQLLPKLYPNLRIMSFSYDVDVTHLCGASLVADGDVKEHANTLLAWLHARRRADSVNPTRPLIFFGHSLGGLVIEHALLMASKEERNWLFELYRATVGVYVFGTPHHGSHYASLAVPVAEMIRPFHFININILRDLLPAPLRRRIEQNTQDEGGEESTWQKDLVSLLERRKADNNPIQFFCGFEQLGRRFMPRLHRVVPADSAVLCQDHSIVEQAGFHVTHTELVRFSGPLDPAFQIFDCHLRSLLLHLPTQTGEEGQAGENTADQSGRGIRRIDVLPIMVKTFVGREEPLKKIYDDMKVWSRDRPAVVVLIANGGYGKSQIALEYARRHFQLRTYDHVFWANASSEQAAKISFAQFWDRISPNSGFTPDEKFEKAFQALRNMTVRWLLVLDNFDRSVLDSDEMITEGNRLQQGDQGQQPADIRHGTPDSERDVRDSYIKNFLPPNDFGHVIITTRDKRVRHLGDTVKVKLMTEDEAVSMLKERVSKLDSAVVLWDDSEAKVIVKQVGYLPLAIEQVSSYIISAQCSLKTFLSDYQRKRRDIFQRVPEESNLRKGRVHDELGYVRKSLGVLEVWEMSLDAVQRHSNQRIRDVACAILNASGFLDRTGISIKFLTKLEVSSRGLIHWTAHGRDGITLLELDKAAKLLDSWSLIESIDKDPDQDQVEKLTVHPLIQDWIRLRLADSELESKALGAIHLIERNLAQDHDKLLATSVESKMEIVRHVGAIRNLLEIEAPKRAEFQVLKGLELGKGILSQAAITFASFQYDLGNLATATLLFERVLNGHRGENQNSDPFFLQAEEGLALVRLWEENGDAAFELLHHAVQGYALLPPKEYSRPLHRATHNLGEVECFRKNFDAAINLFKASLQGFRGEFGQRSKEVYREQEALGNAYRAKGMIQDALREVSEAYNGLMEVDPKGDTTTNATESLALVMKALGNCMRAEELYRHVISVYERSIGKNHYTTIGAMGGLADTYRKGAKWEEAAEVYAEIMRRLRGTMSTGDVQYKRAKEAWENLTSGEQEPQRGPPDDFSYPWPRAVAELQTSPSTARGESVSHTVN